MNARLRRVLPIALACLLAARAGAEAPARLAGAETWARYCATCHGLDGMGRGASVGAATPSAPDLRVLRARSGRPFAAGPLGFESDDFRARAPGARCGARELARGRGAGRSSRIEARSLVLEALHYADAMTGRAGAGSAVLELAEEPSR